MKILSSVLFAAVAISGCATQPPLQTTDVFSKLVGTWDDVHEDSCKTNPHLLNFDDARTTMMVTYTEAGWASENDSRKVFRYQILDVAQSSLRVKLENEARVDDQGRTVVWSIVLVDDKTYCWSRDDWPQGACTPPRIRCGASGPLGADESARR